MPATPVWLAALESLLNRAVQSSERAQALAERLHDTTIRVDIEGLASLRVAVAGGRMVLTAASPSGERIDASLAGSPLALLNLALGRAGAGGIGARAPAAAGPIMQGDAEIASAYRELFAAARPDLEEELSRFVGDFAARRLSLFTREAVEWLRKVRRTAAENVAEYLQEESRDVVGRYELDEFLHGVDLAREAADRIEARIVRLERRLRGSA